MNNKLNTRSMVILGLLTAVVVVFSFTPIGSIPIGPLVITLNVIPVAIAGIALGPIGGLIMGSIFGIFSFLQCFGIGIASGMGAILADINPVLAFIQRFVPRALDGFLIGCIFRGLSRIKSPRTMRIVMSAGAAVFSLALFASASALMFSQDAVPAEFKFSSESSDSSVRVGINGTGKSDALIRLSSSDGVSFEDVKLSGGETVSVGDTLVFYAGKEVSLTGLDDGDYIIDELSAPENLSAPEKTEFTVSGGRITKLGGEDAESNDIVITNKRVSKLADMKGQTAFTCIFIALLGLLVGWLATGSRKKKAEPIHVSFAVTGFCTAFLNTVFFMSALVILFGSTDYVKGLMGGKNILAFICTFVGINAVFEMVVSTIVTSAVCIALYKAKLITLPVSKDTVDRQTS